MIFLQHTQKQNITLSFLFIFSLPCLSLPPTTSSLSICVFFLPLIGKCVFARGGVALRRENSILHFFCSAALFFRCYCSLFCIGTIEGQPGEEIPFDIEHKRV